MADNPGRTFTEGEAYALVQDNVARETAAATTRIAELETEKTGLQNRLDVLETEKAAEAQRADQAEQAFTEFKEQLEAEKAREAKRAERVAQVAEANPLLEITDERSDRIVAMDQEVFEGYLADLREVAAKAPKADDKGKDGSDPDEPDADDKKSSKGKGGVPRESAAFRGADAGATTPQGPVTALIGARRGLKSA
jgi:hypothetical protein